MAHSEPTTSSKPILTNTTINFPSTTIRMEKPITKLQSPFNFTHKDLNEVIINRTPAQIASQQLNTGGSTSNLSSSGTNALRHFNSFDNESLLLADK